MLTNSAAQFSGLSTARSKRESHDVLMDLHVGKKGAATSTSSTAKRQNKFINQRVSSSVDYSEDPEELKNIMAEHAKMGSALPTDLSSQYSCCVLTRIKRASTSIFNHADPKHFDGNNDNDIHFDSDAWAIITIEQKKRHAQDTLLFREIKAGLIPEQLLKKIPRMGALVSLDLSYFSLGDELCACLGKR